MAIIFLEAGTNATFGLEWWAHGGSDDTESSSTTVTHTGPRSLKLVSVGGSSYVFKTGILADAGRRISFYVQFTAFAASTVQFVTVADSGFNNSWHLKITSAGVLQVFNDSSVQLGSNGSTLSLNTWYRISLAFTNAGGGTNELRIYKDGTLDISVTNGAWSRDAVSVLYFLSVSGTTLYVSDVYVDDSSALTDPGDIRVTAKRPAANNTNNFNTAIGANPANRWTNVNERPLSETNGWEDTTAVGDQENYGLEAASAGDVDVSTATLVGRCAWIWAKVDVASVLSKIMDNGSESAITLTTSSALYTLLTTSASYPSNAAGIGIRSSTTPNTFLYECGTLIAYTPATGPTVAQMTPAWEQLADGGGLFAKRYV